MKAYIKALNDQQYERAAELYGGEYDPLLSFNPDLNEDNRSVLFEKACEVNGYLCSLVVNNVVDTAKIGEGTYRFVVDFRSSSGEQFSLQACCGIEIAESPPVTQFTYWVVKTDKGEYLVRELPVYLP